MTKGLTKEELKKMERIFCPKDIEIILTKFSRDDIRKVIDHPVIKK